MKRNQMSRKKTMIAACITLPAIAAIVITKAADIRKRKQYHTV